MTLNSLNTLLKTNLLSTWRSLWILSLRSSERSSWPVHHRRPSEITSLARNSMENRGVTTFAWSTLQLCVSGRLRAWLWALRLTLGSRQWVGWRLPANCRSTGHLASESRQQKSAASLSSLGHGHLQGFLLFNDGGVFNFDPCQHSQINYIRKLQEARPSQALRLELVSLICQNFGRDCGQHKSWHRSLRWSLVI